jgi:arylsulfatase A-like enzyme
VRQGVSLRTPAAVPPLTSSRTPPPDVLVILTESVRADATCSEASPGCASPFLDEVVPDRVALGKLTSQTPNTFSACMVLWTGLSPDVDFNVAHTAPVLWEVARAAGYETAYVTSQNPNYEDFGAFVRNAGIDTLATALDLGGLGEEQLGAPDENATRELLRVMRARRSGKPLFAVLHLSNTHASYRVDPALAPFAPASDDPLGPVEAFHNRYRNSVRMQERTVAAFLKEVRAMPSWDRTALVFLSDHGEQFREHGGLYHNHSLYDEETRIPGWLALGPHALGPLSGAALHALATYRGARTYTQDVHATVLDLLGVYDQAPSLPLAGKVGGRSLLRPRVAAEEPTALMATSTAVWEPDSAWFGATLGEWLLAAPPAAPWLCYDHARDPTERTSLPESSCPVLLRREVHRAFPAAGRP